MILNPGDQVMVVAPASAMRADDRGLVDGAARMLEAWGLVPTVHIEEAGYMYLAGPDGYRRNALEAALAAPSIRAIFCSRGGYGSQRLLRQLDFSLVPAERLLVGFSDITALHLAALAYAERNPSTLHLMHGPNVATHQLLGDDGETSRAQLRRVLFDPAPVRETVDFLIDGAAVGRLIGGCLSLIAAQVGTPFLPSFDEAILFVEDVGESPYKIDRMLHQLLNAGLLDQVAGIVFGVMHNCADPYNDIRDVIVDVLTPLGVPLAFGLPSGHGPVNLTIPLGTATALDSGTSVISIDRGRPASL